MILRSKIDRGVLLLPLICYNECPDMKLPPDTIKMEKNDCISIDKDYYLSSDKKFLMIKPTESKYMNTNYILTSVFPDTKTVFDLIDISL